jgi:hypothetical protein
MMANKKLYKDINRVAQFKRSGVVEDEDGGCCCWGPKKELRMFEVKR